MVLTTSSPRPRAYVGRSLRSQEAPCSYLQLLLESVPRLIQRGRKHTWLDNNGVGPMHIAVLLQNGWRRTSSRRMLMVLTQLQPLRTLHNPGSDYGYHRHKLQEKHNLHHVLGAPRELLQQVTLGGHLKGAKQGEAEGKHNTGCHRHMSP